MPSDIEMGDADQQSENGSVTTAESSQADEYDVEEILAERGRNQYKHYLVKWLGYPIHRSSWEPKTSFDNDEPLKDWKAKLAKIKAKQLPPFDVEAWEDDLERRENETQARREARRRRREARQIKKHQALKSTLFSDDEDTDQNQSDQNQSDQNQADQNQADQNQMLEAPLSWDEADQQAALFVSTDSSYSDDTSDDSSDHNSEANVSTALAHSRIPDVSQPLTTTTEPPVISEKPTESAPKPLLNVSRAAPGPNQVASKTAQNPQPTASTPKSGTAGNSTEQQASSRKVSTSMEAPPNRITNAPARPPAVLAGFGDINAAPIKATHRTNTKWYSRESRWGSDRAPTNASDLHLFKPSETTPLRNWQVNAGPVSNQVLSEQSNDLGITAPGSTTLTSAHSHDTTETPQRQPATNTEPGINTAQAVSSLQMHFARANPRVTIPNIGSPTLNEQETRQGSSAKYQRQSIQAPARRPALDSYRPSEIQPAENRSPLDSHEPAESRNRPLAPPLSPAQRTASAPSSTHRNSAPPRTSSIGGRFKDTRMQSQDDNTDLALRRRQLSENELISRMPLEEPGKDTWLLPNGHFWNRKEVYVHIFFGPQKAFVGQVRVCGMPWKFRNRLIQMRSGPRGNINMWFKEICNVEQYAGLCDLCPGAEGNRLFATCWMVGFRDTNPELFRFAQMLGQRQIMAICSPPSQKNEVAWLLHSRMSSDFDFLVPQGGVIPDNTPLVLSVRASIPPVSFLSNLHKERIGVRAPEAPDPADTPFDFGESPSRTPATEPHPNVLQERKLSEGPEHLFGRNPNGAPQEIYESGFFSSQLKITIERLARLKDSSKAENFFLHFPDVEGNEEMHIMREWLKSNDMIVYTNLDPSGWKRFLRNSRCGVVVFHDSFTDFHLLRPYIGKCVLMHELFNVWSIRIHGKIQRTDSRGLRVDAHSQCLFSNGGLILISEDIFRDLKITAILVYWFFFFCREKDNQGWKLVLPPNAWKRLQQRLQNSRNDEETCLLLSIIAWIKRNNSIDVKFPYFREESLSPSKIDDVNTNIISLPIAGYGSRSEDASPFIPRGLSQQERDMDHLAEAFAGWALTKSDCFRRMFILSSVKLPALRERWQNWGHLVLYEPDDFFRLFKICEEAIMPYIRGEKTSQSSNISTRALLPSQPFLPETPTTPADSPAGARQGDHWKSPSKLQCAN